MSLVHGVAVTAATVHLAERLDSEVGDGQAASTIMLEDLVLGTVGTASRDILKKKGFLVSLYL